VRRFIVHHPLPICSRRLMRRFAVVEVVRQDTWVVEAFVVTPLCGTEPPEPPRLPGHRMPEERPRRRFGVHPVTMRTSLPSAISWLSARLILGCTAKRAKILAKKHNLSAWLGGALRCGVLLKALGRGAWVYIKRF